MKMFFPGHFFLLIAFAVISFLSCKPQPRMAIVQKKFPAFYKEGHRGARGLMPENTIPGMKKAIDVGANVLEVDVYISKDRQVVVTHDPYINRNFTLLPNGGEIPEEAAKKYVIYQMDYTKIRAFDVGSKYYAAFPDQKKNACLYTFVRRID